MGEIKVRAGRLLVRDWGTHFLVDDTELRDGEEAYSLFRVEPYGRVYVYTGPKEWAISQAIIAIERSEDGQS